MFRNINFLEGFRQDLSINAKIGLENIIQIFIFIIDNIYYIVFIKKLQGKSSGRKDNISTMFILVKRYEIC